MNVTDTKAPAYPVMGDALGMIFIRQKELMGKYHWIEQENGFRVPHLVPVDIHDAHDQHYIKDMNSRVIEELMEAMNCLKNKPWKQTHLLTDEVHFKEEIVDAFHFFIELCILVGLGPQELFDFYFRKAAVNEFRQESKY